MSREEPNEEHASEGAAGGAGQSADPEPEREAARSGHAAPEWDEFYRKVRAAILGMRSGGTD